MPGHIARDQVIARVFQLDSGDTQARMTTCGIVFLRGGVDPIGAAVAGGFTDAGCTVRPLYPGRDSDLSDLSGLDLVVIYGPAQSLAATIPMLSSHHPRPPVLVWLTEQVPDPRGRPTGGIAWQAAAARWRFRLEMLGGRAKGLHADPPATVQTVLRRAGRLRILGELLALRDLGCLTLIAAFTETNAAYLRRHGLPAVVIPMGGHASFGRPMGLPRDIDVVFLGTLRDRRRAGIIRKLQRDLDRRGLALTIRDGSPARGYAYGTERIVLLNRAKIMLNVMRQPWDDGVHRMLLAAPNGAMVVSEPIIPSSWGPFRPGVDFVMAPHAALADTIARYVADDDARQAIASQACNRVNSQLTMRGMVERVLTELDFIAG
jgi:hypothetical protein